MRYIHLLFFFSFLISAGDNGNSALDACNQLRASLGAEIVQLSQDPDYTAGATGAWNLLNDQQKPDCIVFPRNSSHVQTGMKAIFAHKARYAVQAGGHSAMQGWNNVQAGVLILFSHMTNFSFDASKDIITLQPGVRWGDVVTGLEPLGVAPVGGRQSDVGTGYLLGGGLSFLSPMHGFGADTFKALDVVIVNGDLVTATADNDYKDLFRALKGGGNRFGIVTRYEISAVHTGTKEDKGWFGGSLTYAEPSAEAVLNATAAYVRNVKDPKAVLLVSLVEVISGGVATLISLVNIFYNGTQLPPDIFDDFLAIPTLSNSLTPLSYYDMANTLPVGNDHGNVQMFGASALVGDEKLYNDALGHFRNFSQTFKYDLSMSVLGFTPVLDPQILVGRARGGNAMSPPLGGYAAVQIAKTLAPNLTHIPPDFAQGVELLFKQIPGSPGQPLFMNECDAKQNVFATYGDFDTLQRTYLKYDPERFNMQHTDGPVGL